MALAPIVLISFIVLFVANKAVSHDTTSFAINAFYPIPAVELAYQGHAHVLPGSTTLDLTRSDSGDWPTTDSAGRALYSSPVKFWDEGRQASFETTIIFTIAPIDENPGDGVTFFIEPFGTRIPPDASGGRLGIFNASGTSPSLFAVEFDTYTNTELGDPSYPHIGIDINSLSSRNVTRFDTRRAGRTVRARISYDATTRRISVDASSESATYTLSYVFDLKTILPGQVQVGISGSTGGSVEVNILSEWNFTSTMVSDRNTIRQYV